MANTLAFFLLLANLSLLTVIYPRETGIHYLSLAALLMPFLLWQLQSKWLVILELSVCIAAFASLPLVFPAEPPSLEMARGYERGIAFVVRGILFYSFAAFLYHIATRLIRTERQFITEQKLRERLLTDIIPALEQSEKRYAHLVEDAPDIIFSLAEDLTIKTINKTVRKILQYDSAQLIGKPISVLVFSDGESDLDSQILMDNLKTLQATKDHVDFRLNLKGKHHQEPLPMRIALSYSQSEDQREILGKASPMTEDKMSKFLARERAEYTLDNSLLNAEALSVQLTRNLHTRMNKSDLVSMRIALREMLINAVEHGNLNITFDEKTQAQLEGRYLELLKERQEDSAFSGRRVRVEYVLKNYMVAFRITDEGAGFAFEEFTQGLQKRVNEEGLQHGRGIQMTRQAFDRIQYFAPGNRVILAKRF